jgi:hypothetical protein
MIRVWGWLRCALIMSRSSRGINAENSSSKENMCADGLANRGYKFNYL